MAASISSVTTMAFSNGTFDGSIALVVTFGYGIGAGAAAASPMTGWRSCLQSRSLVSKSDRAVVAERHSRVVVCYPEVRR